MSVAPEIGDTADGAGAPLPESRWPGLAARSDETSGGAARDAFVYTLGTYASQALLFCAGLLQKGLLGPTGTGYWALMTTFYAFFGISSFGVFHAAIREVPARRGRAEYGDAAAGADTASSVAVAAMTAAGIAAAAVGLLLGDSWAPELRWGLVALGLTAPIRALVDAHELLLQVTKRFPVLSVTLVLKALVTLSAQTLLVLAFGFYGMFAGVVAVSLAALGYWVSRGLTGFRTPAFRWRIERVRMRRLAGIGLPIMVYSQVWVLFVSVDSLIVARFIDVRNLGYYALAVSVTNYVMLLPNAVAVALFPRMQERFAPRERGSDVAFYVTDVQRILTFLLVPLLIGGIFFLVPPFLGVVLGSFRASFTLIRISVAGSFALALVHMPIELLITIGKRWLATALLLGGLTVNAAANYVAVAWWHDGIRGAAIATVASYVLLALAATSVFLLHAVERRKALEHLGSLAAGGAYVVAALWSIRALARDLVGGSEVADVVGAALYLAAIAPLAVWTAHRYALGQLAAAALRSGKARVATSRLRLG